MFSESRHRTGSSANRRNPTTSGGRATVAGGAIKDASHAVFYAGVGKGFVSGINGALLFWSRQDLKDLFRSALDDVATAQVGYLVLLVAVILMVREPTNSLSEIVWTFSRWARMVTLMVTLVLERKTKATESMFFCALRATDPQFAQAVQAQEPIKATKTEKFHKYERIAKMASIRIATMICSKYLPSTKWFAIPALKFVSVRQTLGDKVAVSVAMVHVLPDSFLQASHLDDMLLTFTESVLDADDLGFDSVRAYVKRLDGEATRQYFRQRYRGYLTGMGFLYSVLMQIPFLGIPLILIAECAAAVLVVDIVQRNLEKDNRLPLTGEHVLKSPPRNTQKLD